MAKVYGEDMSDKHLKVHSIEVLEDISGNGIKKIQDKVEAIEQTLMFQPEKVDYWSQLSDDGLITPVEKKSLKAQWEQIESMYTAMRQIVEEKSLIYEVFWTSYLAAYTNLNRYLNETLEVFADMFTNTAIDSRENFNNFFTLYYDEETNCNRNITEAGIGYQEYQFAAGDLDSHPAEDSTEWKDSPPAVLPAGKYIWMRTKWTAGVKE